jgi:hypothetical protein
MDGGKSKFELKVISIGQDCNIIIVCREIDLDSLLTKRFPVDIGKVSQSIAPCDSTN